jgi:hypothetical protein
MKIGNIQGVWNIIGMENWDEDYYNMENQAYIEFKKDHRGSFQFGLVRGNFNGEVYQYKNREERFEFTWEGNDESEEVFGFGWVKRESLGRLEGEFRIHQGESSKFQAIGNGYTKYLDRLFNIKDREERIATIIGDRGLSVNATTLKKYLIFLKENIGLPYQVTGTSSYFTYSKYKKNTPNGNEKFEIIEFEDDVKNSSNLFIKVKRLSESGGIFSLQLFEFESINKKTIEHKILKDYTYWIENYL